MMNHVLTIENVERSFANWRANKKQQPNIPDALWAQVKILLKSNARSDILKRLGVTLKQARRKGVLADACNALTSSNTFVQIPITQAALPIEVQSITSITNNLTIQCGELQMCLTSPSSEQLQLIINTFMR